VILIFDLQIISAGGDLARRYCACLKRKDVATT